MSAFIKNLFGRVSSIAIVLKGVPLPEIRHQRLTHETNDVEVHWDAPSTEIFNITYGIYYGTTMDELYESKCDALYFPKRTHFHSFL